MLRGAIDALSPDGVVGWVYGRDLQKPPKIRALLERQVVGEAVADLYRPDLEKVGFGDGRCGFEIRFSRRLEPAEIAFVSVQPEGCNLSIPTHNRIAYLDLLRGIFPDYQGAGRDRSVLGGLWTDRTDAPNRLHGRIAAGSLSAGVQPILQDLITDGFVKLSGAAAPDGLTDAHLLQAQLCAAPQSGEPRSSAQLAKLKPALSGMAALLFGGPLPAVLRAVLDDQPVGYRLDVLRAPTSYWQAVCFEPLPSPAECMVLYLAHEAAPARLDYLRGSHELPEFTRTGQSRWTPAGADGTGALALEAGLSVETVALERLDICLVGPGLIHRAVPEPGGALLRALIAPRRVTPLRFLSGDTYWQEESHPSGARLRI
jgi:hypothetical protein